jgi:hypothetical protein
MRIALATALALALTAALSAQAGKPGALSQPDTLKSEVIITILPTADLRTQIMSDKGTFDHKSEVTRGGPVAAVIMTQGCEKDTKGACKMNADIMVYKPDGTVFHAAKNLDLPAGRGAVPLTFDASAVTGVYRVVATIRDLTARRFASVERMFGVK